MIEGEIKVGDLIVVLSTDRNNGEITEVWDVLVRVVKESPPRYFWTDSVEEHPFNAAVDFSTASGWPERDLRYSGVRYSDSMKPRHWKEGDPPTDWETPHPDYYDKTIRLSAQESREERRRIAKEQIEEVVKITGTVNETVEKVFIGENADIKFGGTLIVGPPCTTCNRSGKIEVGGFIPISMACPDCNGTGWSRIDSPQIECPACDGDGSLSAQWAKEACEKIGGYSKPGAGPYFKKVYYTPDGKELPFKTIGGSCQVCKGTKVAQSSSSSESPPTNSASSTESSSS